MGAGPPSNSYWQRPPGARSDRADEAELLEGSHTVVQADLLGDFAVLDAKHGRFSEPHFPASRCLSLLKIPSEPEFERLLELLLNRCAQTRRTAIRTTSGGPL